MRWLEICARWAGTQHVWGILHLSSLTFIGFPKSHKVLADGMNSPFATKPWKPGLDATYYCRLVIYTQGYWPRDLSTLNPILTF
ncbi:hypothetical protein I7I48_04602 [Histoplasma ohiense]|nr:hypothetical protein I7I48_04602 [Histoplasma ohiense (nom. inval.)]